MKNLITTGIALLLFIRTVFAAEPPISVEELSKILGYPTEKLKVQDVTEDWNKVALRKGRPTRSSSHVYTGDSASFAPISIGFANEGSLLSEEQRLKIAVAITNMAELTAPYLVTKWLSFEDVGYGLAGLGFPGQGGSQERLLMTIYGKADVQISIDFDKDPLVVLPGAESYNELVREGLVSEKGGLSGRLIDALTLIASKSAGRPITVTAGTEMPVRPPSLPSTTNTAQTVPKVEPDVPEPSVTNQPVQTAPQAYVEPQSAAQAAPPANPVSSMKNIFIVLAVLLVLAAGWILFRAKK